MTQLKILVDDVLPLVEPNKGNVAAIARKLGVNRSTIWNRCNESPTLMQALTDAREAMLDNAESVLYKKVLEGSTPELIFFLKTQGRSRGYFEKQENVLSTDKDNPLTIEVKYINYRNELAALEE